MTRDSLSPIQIPAPAPASARDSDRAPAVVHVIPYLGRAQGGPVFSLAALTSAQANYADRVAIFGARLDSDGDLMSFDPRVNVSVFPAKESLGFRRCPDLRAMVNAFVENSVAMPAGAIIHSHSLWTDANRAAAGVARKFQVPHVVSICGALSPDALRRRAWKKWPARAWFQDAALRAASILHAKSDKEAAEIRAYGLRAPIARIPNPIECPIESNLDFKSDHDIPDQKRVALYLGRLHPVKGVARLIEAWAALPHDLRRDWNLVLAGPDEANHRSILERRAAELHVAAEIIFTGPLNDGRKWAAYRAADLFVMPSDFENFGLAIAEAMLAGTPPLTNTAAPWESLVEARAGWRVAPGVEPLREGLEAAMSLPEAARREMGRRAQALAARFRPEAIAREMLAVYAWILQCGPRPDCVHVE